MTACGTKRNCRGAHGISGAEGRPAVPSTWRRQPPLTQSRRTWRNRSRSQGSVRRVNSFFDSVRAQTFQRIRIPLFGSGVAPLGNLARGLRWSQSLCPADGASARGATVGAPGLFRQKGRGAQARILETRPQRTMTIGTFPLWRVILTETSLPYRRSKTSATPCFAFKPRRCSWSRKSGNTGRSNRISPPF